MQFTNYVMRIFRLLKFKGGKDTPKSIDRIEVH